MGRRPPPLLLLLVAAVAAAATALLVAPGAAGDVPGVTSAVSVSLLSLEFPGTQGGQRQQLRELQFRRALNRLRILESLDGQLERFVRLAAGRGGRHHKGRRRLARQPQASAAAASKRPSGGVCRLPLVWQLGQLSHNNDSHGQPWCLRSHPTTSTKWANQERHRWWPYPLVPPYMLNLWRRLEAEARSLEEAVRLMPYESLIMRSFRQPRTGGGHVDRGDNGRAAYAATGLISGQVEEQEDVVVELSATMAPLVPPQEAQEEEQQQQPPSRPPHCSAARLCYWFRLGPAQLQRRMNGSLEALKEAELHLHKLLPLLPPPARPTATLAAHHSNSSSIKRLKTNLLEVRLHQVLPPGDQLRLLDIRRMDLHAAGWETFYVKRAVEDWLREPASNLGLVIKAKSMLDEPIGIGLIRFAGPTLAGDREDDREDQDDGRQESPPPPTAESLEFNLSHQPILVIYTRPKPAATIGQRALHISSFRHAT